MRKLRTLALITSFTLLAALTACRATPAGQQPSEHAGAYLYGTDGNMQNQFGELFGEEPGILRGMKGTAPGRQLPLDFVNRLKAIDPSLSGYLFGGETYDAIVISAIAAQLAGTTDPAIVASYVNGVTVDGTACYSVAECLGLARQGEDVWYRGVTVRNGFADVGEPPTGSYAILHFDQSNRLDDAKTEYLATGAENPAPEDPPAPVPGGRRPTGAPLVFGGLFPFTGPLSFAVPPLVAAAELAIQEINDAGGVLGSRVQWRDGDSATDGDVALATLREHKAEGVHVVIGPAASGTTLAVLPELPELKMILFSPANTAAALSTAEDGGFYFRSAPVDNLQARAIADVIVRDGVRRVAVVVRDDAYGTGLMEGVRAELISAGLAEADLLTLTYTLGDGDTVADPAELVGIANQVMAFQPGGVLVVGFSESADAIRALKEANLQVRS